MQQEYTFAADLSSIFLPKLREAEAKMRGQLEAQFSKDLEHQLASERQAAEKRGREEAQKEIVAIRTQMNQSQQRVEELEAREAEVRKQATMQAEAMFKKEIERQRIILQDTHDADLRKHRSESNHENEVLLKKVQDLQRKLEQKSADQLGDGAEVDLYEALRQEFPGDRISRVPKGQPGPDIRQQVLYKGECCGQIVYDSKNQQQWRESWITKLHQDQIDTGAEHAILATTVFPAGKKEIWIDDSEVILVNPARAVHITHLLREAMVAMHVKGLGQKERAGKTNKLYEYIRSNEYRQQFDQVHSLTGELLDIDVDETKEHQKRWDKRGKLLRKQQHALREIDTKVAAIIEAPEAGQRPAA